MKREVIENLTVENDEYVCHITKKEITDGQDFQKFFDKLKIIRKSDKKTMLSFKAQQESEAFLDICQKIVPVAGTYIQQHQVISSQSQQPIVPFSATNPEAYLKQSHNIQPQQVDTNNGLPVPKKVNVFEVKEEGGITSIVQVNKAEQEAQELAKAQASLERKEEASGEDLLKQMAKDFKALTEEELPPEKRKALEEKKKRFPGFFNAKK